MSGSRALEALLAGVVDYAGLFPPAALAMPAAVRRYAGFAAGPERWMLGRFVVPVARLGEYAEAVAALGSSGPSTASPWRVSVLATASDATALAAFNSMARGRLVIDTVEAAAEDPATVSALSAALGGSFTVYVEIPVREDPSSLVSAIGAQGLRAKVRTGGVTVEAFPSPANVLRFLVACVRANVPFKATAGLHHPLCGDYALTYAPDSVRGAMYGFLNLFIAAALLHDAVPPDEVAPLLTERNPAAIVVDSDGIQWNGFRVTVARVAAARAGFAGSFGSCSFEEPVHELTSLRLL